MLNKDPDTAYVNALYAVCKAIDDFVTKNMTTLTKWSGSQDSAGAAAFYASACAGGVPAAPQEETKVEEKPKAAPAKKPVEKKVKKPSKTQDMRKMWTIENFVKEDVTLEGDDISFKTGIRVFACKDMTINIKGKCKSMMMEGCKNVTIVLEKIVAPLEIINCNTCKVYGIEQLQHISVEGSIEIKVFLTNATRECCVQTTCSSNVNVKFPKEGKSDQSEENDDWQTCLIAEAFETRITGDTIETKPAELGDM